MDPTAIEHERTEAAKEINGVLKQLDNDYPGALEGVGAALGAGIGGAGAFGALFLAGTTGLSAAGITSGLATAGALIGGGMVAGIGVLAAPMAILGVAGYALAKKRKNAKHAAALATAIAKLYDIQTRLMQNAQYFREELAQIKATIDFLKNRKVA